MRFLQSTFYLMRIAEMSDRMARRRRADKARAKALKKQRKLQKKLAKQQGYYHP